MTRDEQAHVLASLQTYMFDREYGLSRAYALGVLAGSGWSGWHGPLPDKIGRRYVQRELHPRLVAAEWAVFGDDLVTPAFRAGYERSRAIRSPAASRLERAGARLPAVWGLVRRWYALRWALGC